MTSKAFELSQLGDIVAVSNTGNIGVGTSSPTYALSVGANNNGFYSDANGFYLVQATSVSDVLSLRSSGFVDYRSDDADVTVNTGHRFYTDNTERLRINSSGNVGIGTTSPSAKLHVDGGDGNHIRYSGATNTVAMGMTGANPFIGSLTSAPLLFLTGGTERARIDIAGSLGIGTQFPTSITGYSNLTVGGSQRGLLTLRDATDMDVAYYSVESSGATTLETTGQGDLNLKVWGGYNFTASTAGTERLRVTSAGDVGIGTSSPSAKLMSQVNTFTDADKVALKAYNAQGVGAYASFQNSVTGTAFTDGFRVGINDSEDAVLQNLEATNMLFATSGAERMRIDASGNVGIGAAPTAFGRFEVTQATNKRILTSTAAAYGGNAIVGINDAGAEVAFGIAGNPLIFSTNAAERMRLDASGNLGLGVTPSAWAAGKAVEIGATGNAIAGFSAGDLELFSGAYYNAGYKYSGTGLAAANYRLISGSHQWFTAPSGTAGNAITFTQAMTLLSGGDVLIGTTSGLGPGARVNVVSGGNTLHLKSTSGSAKNIVAYNSAGGESFNVAGNGVLFSNAHYSYGSMRSWSGGTTFGDVLRINKSTGGTIIHRFIIKGYSGENGGMQPWEIYFYMHDRSTSTPYGDFFGLTYSTPTGTLHTGSSLMEFQITNKGVTNGPLFVQARNTTYGYSFEVTEFYHNTADYFFDWLV